MRSQVSKASAFKKIFPLVDSHCHLNYGGLGDALPAVLKRAEDAGVTKMLCINTKLNQFEDVYTIARKNSNVWATVGVHPHEAGDVSNHPSPTFVKDFLLRMAERDKVVGFGETGLDFFKERSPRDVQVRMFEAHLEAAIEKELPVIVHSRQAEEDTIRVLKQFSGKLRGVIHCFSGTNYLADEALNLGFYISVSGIITFKGAKDLRAVLESVPMDKLLIETDAPYLAPVPFRGKSNEPSYVCYTAEKLAEIKDVDVSVIADQTTHNFHTLFSKVQP